MFDEFDDTEVQMQDDDSSVDEDAPKEMGIGKVRLSLICLLGGETVRTKLHA